MERGPALHLSSMSQDVFLKYLTLAQTSKLVFSFLSPTHPSLEAESIKPSCCLNMAWAWVEGWEDRREGKNWLLSQKCFLLQYSCWP